MLHYDAKQQSHEWGQMHVRRELQPLRWKLVQLKKKRKKKGHFILRQYMWDFTDGL